MQPRRLLDKAAARASCPKSPRAKATHRKDRGQVGERKIFGLVTESIERAGRVRCLCLDSAQAKALKKVFFLACALYSTDRAL